MDKDWVDVGESPPIVDTHFAGDMVFAVDKFFVDVKEVVPTTCSKSYKAAAKGRLSSQKFLVSLE
jgi:hypothetical protein